MPLIWQRQLGSPLLPRTKNALCVCVCLCSCNWQKLRMLLDNTYYRSMQKRNHPELMTLDVVAETIANIDWALSSQVRQRSAENRVDRPGVLAFSNSAAACWK